ncbi:hypothetical protein ES332_A12G210900v1 [Gossypium tomentosum]|uniref:Uncharacterized protein n=1 Tax=Gossypium tomentosum TaxID=34277 RepID=A0A5D2N0W9_GOSTO|nr:hypothetical protein ES332_A12G210900v1 [Gossypium tomentosum]
MPSKLEMVRQEFEREKAKMSRDLSALQEENYQLKIDVQIERSKTEKVQKEAEVEEISNIKGGMEFWKGKAKKEEEKAARAVIELRKKNTEYEAMSAEVMTSRSKRQELKERIRELEDMLQDRQ